MVARHATPEGFRYQAGEEAGSFVDLLKSSYTVELKVRAEWLSRHLVPLSDDDFAHVVRTRMEQWASEFQVDLGPGA